MYSGKLVFARVMDHPPIYTFRRCVARYRGNHKVKRFSCLDQYLCMAFAQLTDPDCWALIPEAARAALGDAPGAVGAAIPVAPFGAPVDAAAAS